MGTGMAADPLSPQTADPSQDPSQGAPAPQEAPQGVSDAHLDEYGHPSLDYTAGCMLKAAEMCKDAAAATDGDPEALQKCGAGAFGFAQAWEKFAGKSAAEPDPVKLAQLDEKARQADVKSGLTAAKQVDDQAHKDQQLGQNAAKTVLDHAQKEKQAEQKAQQSSTPQKPGG